MVTAIYSGGLRVLFSVFREHMTAVIAAPVRRPPDDRKETQSAVVWSCFPFIRSGQNHLARHSERGTKTRWTKEEVGRQHQGMDRPGVRQVPEGSGEQGKIEKTGCKTICGAPTTLAVKGLMMMMMMIKIHCMGRRKDKQPVNQLARWVDSSHVTTDCKSRISRLHQCQKEETQSYVSYLSASFCTYKTARTLRYSSGNP